MKKEQAGPAHIQSAAIYGIEALPVDVEVDVLAGLPSFTVVGLTDKSIQESRERLTAALTNLGYEPPRRKTIVSLAPASLKKEGSLYDVPIALGFLCASRQVKIGFSDLQDSWFVGELGLDGSVRAVKGVLPIVLAAIRNRIKRIYIPADNVEEASPLADEISIYAVHSLQDVALHLTNPVKHGLLPVKQNDFFTKKAAPDINFKDIKGQDHAKRALLVAAAGGHNGLLVGPPGTGKTLLARAMTGILPSLRKEEAYTVTSLYSIAGLLAPEEGLVRQRPFRSPHHGASSSALVGGGSNPRPGEVSLAHHGVLFLDELPEFSRSVLDQLRQPIEDGAVTIARAAHSIRFPARSMLLGAMNPCPCGFNGSQLKECDCSPGEIIRYQRRISGPLLDRFDLHVLVSDISAEELLNKESTGEPSETLSILVEACRQRQWDRQGKANSELAPVEIEDYCQVDSGSQNLLFQAEKKFNLSSRGIHRILKVSRTIADMDDENHIQLKHLAEALQYREQLKASLPDFV